MKNVLGIVGAGVLGQHIAHYASLSGKFMEILFFDDTLKHGFNNKYGLVQGRISDIECYIKSDKIQDVLIGVGYKHAELRKKLYDQLSISVRFPNIVHANCYLDESVIIGNGNIILPGCIIDKDCKIGNNNFFNPGCIIAHDNNIKDHSYFGPGVRTSGSVSIGSSCFFGTATNMIDNISIGDRVFSGAGTLITKSIDKPGTYIGIPARLIKD